MRKCPLSRRRASTTLPSSDHSAGRSQLSFLNKSCHAITVALLLYRSDPIGRCAKAAQFAAQSVQAQYCRRGVGVVTVRPCRSLRRSGTRFASLHRLPTTVMFKTGKAAKAAG
eukprot:1588922-Pyramimonas_sp.AAC.1